MSGSSSESMVFPALLKYWRGVRGMSQLDLALAADVSSRHLSFLETGRSRPSEEMVLRLAATLAVPMREQNAIFLAAGFPSPFPSPAPSPAPSPDSGADSSVPFDGPLGQAIQRMMEKQEPYPLIILDRHYNLLASNKANTRIFTKALGDRAASVTEKGPPNILRLTFDTDGLRPNLIDWESLARLLLLRLQREALQNPADRELKDLLEELLAYPDVPEDWRTPNFSLPSEPTHSVRIRCGEESLHFLTTLTIFNAPQSALLEEIRIENYFPLDATTERVCTEMASKSPCATP